VEIALEINGVLLFGSILYILININY